MGVGLILNQEVAAGQNVMAEGDGFAGGSGGRQKGSFCWCRATVDGRFRAGVSLRLAEKAGAAEDFV